MNKYPFSFKVVLFLSNEIHPYYAQSGIGLCSSFSDAAGQLEKYYGNDLYKIIDLELFAESSLLIMPDEMRRQFNQSEEDFGAPVPCDEDGNIKLEEEEN